MSRFKYVKTASFKALLKHVRIRKRQLATQFTMWNDWRLTFENVYEVGAVDEILKEKEVRKKEQVARLEAADMVKNALERALVCVCVHIYVYMYVRVCM